MSTFNTVHIGGDYQKINDRVCGASSITPGMIVELFDDSGVDKWRPHSGATNMPTRYVALEKLGYGPDDAYAQDDLMLVAAYYPGGMFWGLLPSGQDISNAEPLQSNGDGTLKSATANTAAANVAAYKAKEALGAITETTRCWVEVL